MNKIEALKQTVFNLENNVYVYDWHDAERCNCGVVAMTLLDGRLPSKCGYFDSKSIEGAGCFSSKAHCLTTGLELPLVFQTLKDSGFTYRELCDLEFLADRKIAGIAGLKVSEWTKGQDAAHGQFTKKECLVKYLKAWIEILDAGTTKMQQPSYEDITASLAVLPISETSDLAQTPVLS